MFTPWYQGLKFGQPKQNLHGSPIRPFSEPPAPECLNGGIVTVFSTAANKQATLAFHFMHGRCLTYSMYVAVWQFTVI
jgi:hypothetical protein